MAARKKVSEEISKLRATERAATRREAKRIEEKNREEVVRMLNIQDVEGPKVRSFTDLTVRSNEAQNALCYVLSQRAQKVITSFGVNPRVEVSINKYHSSPSLTAHTDFKSISVEVSAESFSSSDIEKTATTLMSIKGAIYHEAGHLLCTMPFNALFDCVLIERGWYPLTVNPRYHSTEDEYTKALVESFPAYEQEILKGLTYSVTTEDMDDVEKNQLSHARNPKEFMENWVWSTHISRLVDVREKMRVAWGILEDGRMEDQMSRSNPVMEDYFKTMVLGFLISSDLPGYSWPGVVTRTHLGEDLIGYMREFAYQYVEGEGKSRDLVDRIENQVRVYRQSKTIHDVFEAISNMAKLLDEWRPKDDPTEYKQNRDNPTMGNPHRESSHPFGPPVTVTEKPDVGNLSKCWEPAENTDNPQEGEGEGEGEGQGTGQTIGGSSGVKPKSNDQTNNGDSGSEGDEHGEESDTGGSSGTGGVIKSQVDYEALRNKMREMHEKHSNDLVSTDDATKFIAEVNDELRLDVPHNSATTQMSNEVLSRAKEVENGMLSALEPLAVTADPQWRFRQEDGILDPTTYKLKEPGDTDYWLDYEGDGAHGHDLAVSVLLDTSSSMGEWMDELSAGAYGIRKACESLEIPCTVSTFDTQAYLLWGHDEDAQALQVHDGGGTNPLDSLRQLKDQNAGKTKHLIVVLTDGHWSGVNSVIPFIQPNQHWVLVGLSYSQEYAMSLVNSKGGHVAVGITNVKDLPKQVELALSGFLA